MNQSIQKRMMILAVALITSTGLIAQEKKASPAKSATAKVGDNQVTINYSSPSVKGRTIWGDLVPYDKVWRTGANNATTLEVSKDCKVGGKDLKAGKYGLFTIPGKDSWTIIVNSVADQWGAYSYDKAQDVFRFTAKPMKADKTEMFTIAVSDAGKVTLTWDELSVPFEIK
jgi:hypothetical protein